MAKSPSTKSESARRLTPVSTRRFESPWIPWARMIQRSALPGSCVAVTSYVPPAYSPETCPMPSVPESFSA